MKVLLLCLVLGPCIAYGQTAISPDDYVVWHAVIQSVTPKGSTKAIYIWHQIDRSEVYDDKAMKGFRSSMRLLTNQLFDDFNRRNWSRRKPVPLNDEFHLAQPVVLLTPALIKQHVGRVLDEGWWLSPNLLPDGGLVVRVSLPAYSKDSKTAFVLGCLFQPGRADEGYFILRRQEDGSWRIKEQKIWWKSDTPDYTTR